MVLSDSPPSPPSSAPPIIFHSENRMDVGLQTPVIGAMVKEFPELLAVKPKRLKAVFNYLWKVRFVLISGVRTALMFLAVIELFLGLFVPALLSKVVCGEKTNMLYVGEAGRSFFFKNR